jgi:hypothetical protein
MNISHSAVIVIVYNWNESSNSSLELNNQTVRHTAPPECLMRNTCFFFTSGTSPGVALYGLSV